MRLLADENFRADVVASLRAAGHEVASVPSGVTNGAVLELASSEGRALLTHDKDFVTLRAKRSTPVCTIVLIRIHPPEPRRILDALIPALKALESTPSPGRLITVEDVSLS